MRGRSLLSDILRRVSFGPWSGGDGDKTLAGACLTLLDERSEAAGLALAREILQRFETASSEDQRVFFETLAREFGADEEAVRDAMSAWKAGDTDGARRLHYASEPRSLDLLRTLNRVPGATAQLVKMRSELLPMLKDRSDLVGLDSDFRHLFASWFNRGFLELNRIDWNTPAAVLEKIIGYEAVHEISGWDDLRQRVADPDRRLFAFFHPAMRDEPLIFVEVALMERVPAAIAEIILRRQESLDPGMARTAVFYSISNCQKGLRGISFGNFLIKQVVTELIDELPGLERFVTLSPVPGLRRYVGNAADDDPAVGGLSPPAGEHPDDDTARRLATSYLRWAKDETGRANDPVAHFHLSNGAELYDVHANADTSDTGMSNSWGVMVNYHYDPARTEDNHRAYVRDGVIAMSSKVRSLARK